jgi:hypothetical protein
MVEDGVAGGDGVDGDPAARVIVGCISALLELTCFAYKGNNKEINKRK